MKCAQTPRVGAQRAQGAGTHIVVIIFDVGVLCVALSASRGGAVELCAAGRVRGTRD